MNYRNKPPIKDYILRYAKPSPVSFLMHYGTPRHSGRYPYGSGKNPYQHVEKEERGDILRETVSGHFSIPRQSTPNSTLDHIDATGKVDTRTFYGSDGMKVKDIHTTDHRNPKKHTIVPHVHDYIWNEDHSKPKSITTRELTDDERKENKDIL